MLLRCFNKEAYDKLLHDVPINKERYFQDDDWITDYFGSKTNFLAPLEENIEVDEFTPQYVPGNKSDAQKSREDLDNSIRIHKAFRNLTPRRATDKYMWTYLCHAIPEYRKYIVDRWMRDARENTIKNRFFVIENENLRNDNALSRLWWYGRLTYDPQNQDDPYELTKILLTNQTVCTDVMDTLNRMNLNRMKGVLLAIRDFNALISREGGIVYYFRECKKYLNRYAAMTVMESLEPEEIRDLAYEYMVQLRNEGSYKRARKDKKK